MIDPENQPRSFSAARPKQTREANHFTAADVEVYVFDRAATAQPTNFEKRLSRSFGRHGCLQIELRQFLAHHPRDELQSRQRSCLVFADELAVSQNRDPIRNRVNLIEKVRDENDSKP